MAAHKGPASSRPRCTWGGSSVAVIPVYQSYSQSEIFQQYYAVSGVVTGPL
jgi:hypothetical protein